MNNEKDVADYLEAIVSSQGAGVVQTEDGYIILMKRSVLKELLDKKTDSENVLIFVRKSNPTEAN
jgi:hypothetical protein